MKLIAKTNKGTEYLHSKKNAFFVSDNSAGKICKIMNDVKFRLRDLEKTLHSKELLEKLFNEMYIKDYLPEFYNKCLNA